MHKPPRKKRSELCFFCIHFEWEEARDSKEKKNTKRRIEDQGNKVYQEYLA